MSVELQGGLKREEMGHDFFRCMVSLLATAVHSLHTVCWLSLYVGKHLNHVLVHEIACE